MTNQNNAAQAAEQAVKAAIRKAYDDGYNDAKMAPDNCSTYCVERAVRLDSAALLSKLRAPVADERAAFEAWNSKHGQYRRSDAYERDDNGHYLEWAVENGWRVWQARAALASAPVAGEAQPDDLNKRLLEATIRDLAAISEHLGLDPNEGGADPIIEAIDELRRERDDWVDAQYAAAGDAAPQASEAVRDAYERGYRDGLQRGDDHIKGCLV